LKAVLLHNTNSKNSIPIALSTNTKEIYALLKKIIDLVQYNDHKSKICTDLKVVALLKPVSDFGLRLRLDWNLTNQKKENQSQV